jgi:radical SAM protein with 4Fe4S-binding SPASM domain
MMSITTNGTLLRGEREWKQIASLPGLHHVGVSIDAAHPDTYRTIRGGDLSELHDNVLGFFAYLRKRRPEVKRRVCFVTQPGNRGEEQAFLDFWRPHVHQISFYQMTTYQEGAVNFVANYKLNRRTPCEAILSTMYVMPNGDVLPCCLFMYQAPYEGRNAIATFSDNVWTSDEYHRLRASVTSEKFGAVCDRCTIWRQGLDRESVENGLRVTSNPYEKHYYVS